LSAQQSPCSFGLSATSQQYFSLRTNQPTVIFSHNKSTPAISHQPNKQAEYTAQCKQVRVFDPNCMLTMREYRKKSNNIVYRDLLEAYKCCACVVS
jgi:hypothetical protein